jgi:membrane associated rhomboid family serine protease
VTDPERDAAGGPRPQVCRNCGSIVRGGESRCPVCSASLVPTHEARAAVAYDDAARFAGAVFNRPYIFTIVFLVANIFVFLLMWERSGLGITALLSFDGNVLLRFGAKLNVLINQRHEYWRFVTPVFVHGGIVHIGLNMYGLMVLGPYVERLYGSTKFVVIWVLTGIGGTVFSYLAVQPGLSHGTIGRFLFRAADQPSVGASGALFGLVGVLFVFGIKYRHELPDGFKRAFGAGMVPMIVLNMVIGFSIAAIDNAAHIGGMVCGMIFALVVGYERPDGTSANAWLWRSLQAACLCLVAVCFGCALVQRNESYLDLAVGMSRQTAQDLSRFLVAMNTGGTQFVNAVNGGDISGIDAAIHDLQAAPTPDPVAVKLRDDLRDLVLRAKQLRAAEDQDKNGHLAERKNLLGDFHDWQRQQDDWFKTNKDRYGIELTEPADKNTTH